MSKSAILLILLCTPGWGQDKREAPKMLGAVVAENDDVLNTIYKLGLVVESTFRSREDIFAVRVCSNDPLPVALVMARGLPFVITSRLEKLGIPKAQMYYLRQNRNCQLRSNDYALTEYWLVGKNAEFPEFVEARRASGLADNEVTYGDHLGVERVEISSREPEPLTPQSYQMVLDKVVTELKRNKSAVVVIRVPYYKISPTVELKKRLRATQEYLESQGIASHRVYVKRLYSGRSAFGEEEKYPDITLVIEQGS